MTHSPRRFVLLPPLVSLFIAATAAAQPQQEPDASDTSTIYRIQPAVGGAKLVAVSANEIKPSKAYNYYNDRLGRRVWGFATESGSFQYAFGEGTTLPLDRFDFEITSEEQMRILDRTAPDLEWDIQITGRPAMVQLVATSDWELSKVSAPMRVFDLNTGHRWEWHGQRRVAVLHTYGDLWQIVDGRYEPLNLFPHPTCPCGPVRAGSASLVVRTGDPDQSMSQTTARLGGTP